MATPLLDDINTLKNMTDEELRETLLDDKYNKANLREQVRRAISLLKKTEAELQEQVKINVLNEKEKAFVERLLNDINDTFEKGEK